MKTVLVIEDNIDFSNVIRNILISNGFNVVTALNGTEALDLYYSNRRNIDLIILDIMMPDINGYTVLKKIRDLDTTTKVIICTGHDKYEYIDEMLDQANDYLFKPFGIDECLEKINRVINL